jgi:MOSC domain
VLHLTTDQLESGLDHVRRSPAEEGTLELIVARPEVGERKLLDAAELDLVEGLVGDSWATRPSRETPDGSPHPDAQLNVMNARAAALVAGDPDRRALAGDQLYLDFDISDDNAPPGTQLEIGTAIIEITAKPHNGCAKFRARFGVDAVRFVNSPAGKHLKLRGVNAKVIQPGVIKVGDVVRKRR